MTFMTKPERHTDRGQRKRIVAEISRRGGCGCCKNRDKATEAWGRAACQQPSRSFPLCVHTPGIKFELDDQAIKGCE